MVYKKRKYVRRRRPRKSRSVATMVNKAIMAKAEKKTVVTYTNWTDVDENSIRLDICNIAQGDSAATREGNEIYLRSLRFHWKVINFQNAYDLRVIVIQWFDDTIPVLSNILESTAADEFYLSPYEESYKGKYRVLYDYKRTYVDTSDTIAQYAHGQRLITKIPRRKVFYDGSSGSPNMNGLYAFAITNIPDASTGPSIDVMTKLNYLDM